MPREPVGETCSTPVSDKNQFGYRKRKSTDNAMILTLDTITEHLDACVCGVFIDFTSAFNTICPIKLINKLRDMSLHPKLINWTYSFLCGHSQKVTTQIIVSSTIKTSTGNPEGCVLSSILFSIYVDVICSTAETITLIK